MKQKYYHNNYLSFERTLFLLLCNSNHVVFFLAGNGRSPQVHRDSNQVLEVTPRKLLI